MPRYDDDDIDDDNDDDGDGDEGGGVGGGGCTFWNWFAPGQSFSWTQLILPRFMRLALNDLSCEIFYIFGIFILFKAGSNLSLMLNTCIRFGHFDRVPAKFLAQNSSKLLEFALA